jgi:hypothetical protein
VITGIGFDPNPANDVVSVAGVLATVLSVNLANPLAETLTATVPQAALTGPVVVSVNGIASPQNPVFTVLGAGFSSPPSVLFVVPSTASTFVPVSITGQNFGPTPTVTFNGVPAVGIVSLGTKTLPLIGQVSELVVLVPPGATTGPMIVFDQGLPSSAFSFTVQ